jgi:hypothetical protein
LPQGRTAHVACLERRRRRRARGEVRCAGDGAVGATIATKLVELGHEVKMGSRAAGNEKAAAWVEAAGRESLSGKIIVDVALPLGTEMYLPLWLSLSGALGTGQFNIAIVGRTP